LLYLRDQYPYSVSGHHRARRDRGAQGTDLRGFLRRVCAINLMSMTRIWRFSLQNLSPCRMKSAAV